MMYPLQHLTCLYGQLHVKCITLFDHSCPAALEKAGTPFYYQSLNLDSFQKQEKGISVHCFNRKLPANRKYLISMTLTTGNRLSYWVLKSAL